MAGTTDDRIALPIEMRAAPVTGAATDHGDAT